MAFSKSGNVIKIYKNGILNSTNTFTGTAPSYSDGNGLGLGCFHYNGGNLYPYFGAINDFRIYDHCLSAKEIEEIAKGLILHYKLDDPYIESTTNLFKPKPCASGRNWTASGNGVKIDWTAKAEDTYWYL